MRRPAFAPQLKRDPLGGPNMSVHVDAFIEKFRAIVDRYLTGQQALEPAAADFAHVWRDWLRQAGPDASELPTPQPRDTLFPGANVLHGMRELRPGMTDEEFHEIGVLLACAIKKLTPDEEGAA